MAQHNPAHQPDDRLANRVGFYAALFMALITLLTFGFAMTAIPIAGANCPADCIDYPYLETIARYPKDYLWRFPALLLVLSYLVTDVNEEPLQSSANLWSDNKLGPWQQCASEHPNLPHCHLLDWRYLDSHRNPAVATGTFLRSRNLLVDAPADKAEHDDHDSDNDIFLTHLLIPYSR